MAVGRNLDVFGKMFLWQMQTSLDLQTFKDFEVCTDDGPGMTASWNRAIAKSSGEYLARIDADDINYPERFQKQVEFLDAHPEVTVVGSWATRIGSKTGTIKVPPTVGFWELLVWNRVVHSSVMMRKSQIVPYDEKAFWADYDLWIRLHKMGRKIANIQEPLVSIRFHKDSNTAKEKSWAMFKGELQARKTLCL